MNDCNAPAERPFLVYGKRTARDTLCMRSVIQMIDLTRLLQSQRGRSPGELIDRLFVTIFGRDEIVRFIFDANSKSLEAAEHVRSCSE
jgi:hypothetical protein